MAPSQDRRFLWGILTSAVLSSLPNGSLPSFTYGRASDALTFCVLLRIPRLRPPSLPSNILMPTAVSLWAFLRPVRDADGNLICLTCADFTDEAEFRRWKRWSDQDFHAEDKSDVEESDHTTSMDMVPEAALAVPNEDALAEERQVREDQIRCAEAAVSGIRSILTGAQFYRLRQYCIEGKTESEIAEAEGVTQQAVSKSLVSALKKSRKFLKRGPKMVVKKPEKR